MPSTFHGLSLASSALRTFQRAMDVTGHNIANAGRTDYTRQRARLQTAPHVPFHQGTLHHLGSGVELGAIERVRSAFLDQRRATNLSDLGFGSASATGLDRIERAYGEPSDAGISASLGRFFDSWAALGSDPAGESHRLEVQQAGRALSLRINEAAQALTASRDQSLAEQARLTDSAQGLADGIAALNKQIVEAMGGGASPNDLMDQRDTMIAQLSELAPLDVRPQNDGSIQVYIGSQPAVDRTGAADLSTINWGALSGGALAGHASAATAASDQLQRLDDLASALRDEVNALHSTGDSGEDFFAGANALTLSLDPDVAADAALINAGTSGKTGDGALALALADLRTASVASLGGLSLSGHYEGMIADAAEGVNAAEAEYAFDQLLSQQIDAQIQEVSGVNLDEEMADMLKWQRAYQAAATALQIMDETTENLIGVLGR